MEGVDEMDWEWYSENQIVYDNMKLVEELSAVLRNDERNIEALLKRMHVRISLHEYLAAHFDVKRLLNICTNQQSARHVYIHQQCNSLLEFLRVKIEPEQEKLRSRKKSEDGIINDSWRGRTSPNEDMHKESFNWRDRGTMNEVRNQGGSDSCWAITVCEATESILYISKESEDLVQLAPQELIDYIPPPLAITHPIPTRVYPNNLEPAFEYIISKGVSLEYDYPFEAKRGTKRREEETKKWSTITNFSHTNAQDCSDELLKEILSMHPVIGTLKLTYAFVDLKEEIYFGVEEMEDHEVELGEYMELGVGLVTVDHALVTIGWGSYPGHHWIVLGYQRIVLGNTCQTMIANQMAAYHALIIYGWAYDPVRKIYYWKVQNSFGEWWGEKGYGKICMRSSHPFKKQVFYSFGTPQL